MNKKFIIQIGIIITLTFNVMLIYLLLWQPFSIYFERPEVTPPLGLSPLAATLVSFLISLIIILVSTLRMLFVFNRKKKMLWITPMISIGIFWLMQISQSYYPDMTSIYTKDGQRYKVEKWYLNGDDKYYRWRKGGSKWVLDSTNVEN